MTMQALPVVRPTWRPKRRCLERWKPCSPGEQGCYRQLSARRWAALTHNLCYQCKKQSTWAARTAVHVIRANTYTTALCSDGKHACYLTLGAQVGSRYLGLVRHHRPLLWWLPQASDRGPCVTAPTIVSHHG